MISRTLHDQDIEASGTASSGVSWGAILAGAFAAAALSFILVILGFGHRRLHRRTPAREVGQRAYR